MPAPSGFDHVSTTKSNSTRSIAAHPCKKRKDWAPSVEMVHAKIVKGGPPACNFPWMRASLDSEADSPSSGSDDERRQAMSYSISTLLLRNLIYVFGAN